MPASWPSLLVEWSAGYVINDLALQKNGSACELHAIVADLEYEPILRKYSLSIDAP